MDLEGKNALVTGSAKRVGRRTALRLAESGANVAVHYRTSEQEASDAVEELRSKGVDSLAVEADLRDLDEIDLLIDSVVEEFGGLDVLVNNASVFLRTPLGTVTEEDWELNLDVNLRAPFFTSQRAVQEMNGDGDVAGKIVNIADWSGFRPYEGYLPYCVSKAGVIALTKGLAKEAAPEVTVNAVAPGPVMLPPDFTEQDKQEIVERTPLQRIGSPDDIAEGVAFLLEGSDFLTGAIIPIDGGRLIA